MRGFTLIELLLVIVILTLVAAFSIPFLSSFQASSDLYTEANVINQTLRRAQQQATAGQNNSAWGVYFNSSSNNIVMFKGLSYATRDQGEDQIIDYPTIFNIQTTFGSEIVFAVYTGKPAVNGTVKISDSQNNTEKNISVNSFGLIQVND